MTKLLLFLTLNLLLLIPRESYACRQLVNFPEHLSTEDLKMRSNYFVIKIIKSDGESFHGILQNSFGAHQKVGDHVQGIFNRGEEAAARCGLVLKTGVTYLLQSKSSRSPLVISRFNGFNIDQTHEKFSVYIEDLLRGG